MEFNAARFVILDSRGLILGLDTSKIFKPNTVYRIDDILGQLVINEVGPSIIDESNEDMDYSNIKYADINTQVSSYMKELLVPELIDRKRKNINKMKETFKGDVIITDPCYIFSDLEKNYWIDGSIDRSTGVGLEDLGFTSFLWKETLYGDWSCSTLKCENAERTLEEIYKGQDNLNGVQKIGNFCADSGMVGVFLLDEVLKINPNFDYHSERDWTTTLIKNFDGTIEIKDVEDNRHLIGRGNINFLTLQTGF